MNFELIRDKIVTILGDAEAGRYKTIGYQRQSTSSEELEDFSRMVTVYYKSGGFKKSSGSLNGPVHHDITFRIEFLASKSALVDLSVINNPDATEAEKQAAIAALQEASFLVDRSMDELFSIIYQVLMDASNYDLQFTQKGFVSDKWLDSFEKDTPLEQGDLVVLTASVLLTCRTKEVVGGEIGTIPINPEYVTTIDINDDPIQKTEVSVTN